MSKKNKGSYNSNRSGNHSGNRSGNHSGNHSRDNRYLKEEKEITYDSLTADEGLMDGEAAVSRVWPGEEGAAGSGARPGEEEENGEWMQDDSDFENMEILYQEEEPEDKVLKPDVMEDHMREDKIVEFGEAGGKSQRDSRRMTGEPGRTGKRAENRRNMSLDEDIDLD